MNVDVVLYDGFDDLDAMAPFEVLRRVAAVVDDGSEVALVALDGSREVVSAHGARVRTERGLADRPDVVIVPGGGWNAGRPTGARAEVARGGLPAAIARRHADGAIAASVCTGAMVLAAAGLLRGRPAITHHAAIDDLAAAGAHVVPARVVDDGDVVTAGGVTSGLDLALWLVERHHGPAVAADAERRLEYERRGTVWRAAAGDGG